MVEADFYTYYVYGADWCPFCRKAIAILDDIGARSYFFNTADDEEYLREVKFFYKSKTIPVILRGNPETGNVVLIGGCSDLEEALNQFTKKK